MPPVVKVHGLRPAGRPAQAEPRCSTTRSKATQPRPHFPSGARSQVCEGYWPTAARRGSRAWLACHQQGLPRRPRSAGQRLSRRQGRSRGCSLSAPFSAGVPHAEPTRPRAPAPRAPPLVRAPGWWLVLVTMSGFILAGMTGITVIVSCFLLGFSFDTLDPNSEAAGAVGRAGSVLRISRPCSCGAWSSLGRALPIASPRLCLDFSQPLVSSTTGRS